MSTCYTACSVPYSKTNAIVMGTLPSRSFTPRAVPVSITRCCIPAEGSGLVLTVSIVLSSQHENCDWSGVADGGFLLFDHSVSWARNNCRRVDGPALPILQCCFPSSPNALGHIYSGVSHGNSPGDVYTGPVTATQTQGAHTGHVLGQLLPGPSLRRGLAVPHSLLSHAIGSL